MYLKRVLIIGSLVCAATGLGTAAWATKVNVSAAEELTKKSGCNNCHSVSAEKVGPPYKETAAKYKGKPDAEQQLFTHLTTNPEVKGVGKHVSLKTKNEAEIRNVVKYILSR